MVACLHGFPRLYAAASLKRVGGGSLAREPGHRFSAALCRGLIEARILATRTRTTVWFSAALCRGLIEASATCASARCSSSGFPRLYAAASLKR